MSTNLQHGDESTLESAANPVPTSGTGPQASPRAAYPPRSRQTTRLPRPAKPIPCDREYTKDELEFLKAIEEYKTASGRMFPTWSEVLEVCRNLGYEKRENTTLSL
jgi:hypothetical protein